MAYTFDNAPVGGAGGSEDNPYIPQTYNDLLAAIGTANLYVKLTKDFDFSKSSDYKYSIRESILVAARKVFSEEGHQYKINGINCGSCNYFMYTSYISYEAVFENIDIVNIVFYQNSSNYSVGLFYANGAPNVGNVGITFNACRLSFLIVSLTYRPILSSSNI